MKKINFLMTICVILVGFTLNSQNVGISDQSTSLTWVQETQLTNSIVIGSNTANATVSSDMRLKDNIQTLGQTMVNILKLDAKSYTRDGRAEIGLIAQDVQLVYPELVSEDGNGMLAVNYQALSAILINGIKDQEARIQKLELLVKLLLEDK